MRRLAAIFLTLWACVLVPTLPLAAASPEPAAAPCGCCPNGAGCNRECVSLPGAPSAVCTLEQLAPVAPTKVRRAAEADRIARQNPFVGFVQPAKTPALSFAAVPAALAARVPLFKAHCSFLL